MKSNKSKVKSVTVDITTTSSYKSGRKDASELLKNFSLWFCCHLAFYSGFQRKTAQSNVKIYRYCEGFQDRLKEAAKGVGLELGPNGFIDQEGIK